MGLLAAQDHPHLGSILPNLDLAGHHGQYPLLAIILCRDAIHELTISQLPIITFSMQLEDSSSPSWPTD